MQTRSRKRVTAAKKRQAMSYPAFKRLLGETSLERKCRFLFGAFSLLLITGSFSLYAWRTEHLAYDQITTTCRQLVVQIVDRQLATDCRPIARPGGGPGPLKGDAEQKKTAKRWTSFATMAGKTATQELRDYQSWTIDGNDPVDQAPARPAYGTQGVPVQPQQARRPPTPAQPEVSSGSLLRGRLRDQDLSRMSPADERRAPGGRPAGRHQDRNAH